MALTGVHCLRGVDSVNRHLPDNRISRGRPANAIEWESEGVRVMCWLDDEEKRKKLEAIREAVGAIQKHNATTLGDLPGFTPHGAEHSKAVEAYIHDLVPARENLSVEERFCLSAAAWLHDLGMLPSVSLEVHEKGIDGHEIRKLHHLTSESYIVEHWDELAIPETHREVLGKLSRFHRRAEDIEDCDDIFIVERGHVRLRLLACYLRLADALDITGTRTPAEPYAVCLAYDIPDDSKFHWIKSRLVGGVSVDAEDHRIHVQFKRPNWSHLDGRTDRESVEAKLDSIIKLVLNDLREELTTVMDTTTTAGFAYYLNIVKSESSVYLDRRMSNDLRELVLNFDIMAAPSSSKLLEIILVATANILGYSLNKTGEPTRFDEHTDVEAIKVKLPKFMSVVERDILRSRPCHQGLRMLLADCNTYVAALSHQGGLEKVASAVNRRYQKHYQTRQNVRQASADFFEKQLEGRVPTEPIRVLLYGYSELVTKALCGLRDQLIMSMSGVEGMKAIGSPIEQDASDLIAIVICEGQPKTQTGHMDQLVYHDGSQYARHLTQRGFAKVTLIPDAIAGTLLERSHIDYVFVGANCIGEDYFVHAAGHYSIVALASMKRETVGSPKIVLVASEDRRLPDAWERDYRPSSVQPIQTEVDGFTFAAWPDLGANRSSVWMCRDKVLIDALHQSGVSFLNPREDCVPSSMVDFLVTDLGWDSMNAPKTEAVQKGRAGKSKARQSNRGIESNTRVKVAEKRTVRREDVTSTDGCASGDGVIGP